MNGRVIRNAGWMIGARILQMFLGIFISAWTARYLGPSNTGVISYVQSFVTFFAAFSTLGLNDVIIKELIDHEGKEHYVLGTSILMRLASGLCSALLVLGIVGFLNRGDKVMMWAAVLLSFSLIAEAFEMLSYWYQSRLESKVTSIIQTITYLTVAVFRTIGLILNKDVLWFAFVTSLETIVIALLLYISYRRNNPVPLAFDMKLAKEMFSRSHHFIYSGVMIAIYSQMDSIMLKEFLDTSATGYYGIALGINSMWAFILEAIIFSIYPTIIEAKRENQTEVYHHRITQLYSIVFWFSACASIVIMILSRFIIVTLYGEAYLPSASCLRISTWINTFAYLGVARGAWMVSENNQKYQKYILGIGAAVNLVMNYLWIPRFGTVGAAAATLLTQVITSTIAPLVFPRTRENTLFILKALNPAIPLGIVSGLIGRRLHDRT